MAKVAIVYHSGYGHTALIAKHIANGVEQDRDSRAQILDVEKLTEQDWTKLDEADAIVFGAPTYMGGPSGQFKTFLDATSKRWFTMAWKDKIAAAFTVSGSLSGDKLSTLQQIQTTAMQHGMIWTSLGLMPGDGMRKGTAYPDKDSLNRLGSSIGLMAQSNHEAPEAGIPSGDLKTAEAFGSRIAKITEQLAVGRKATDTVAA